MGETFAHGTATAPTSSAGASPSQGLLRLLRDDEELLWSTKPQRRAWYLGHAVLLPFGLLVVATLFGGPFLGFMWLAEGGLPVTLPTLAALVVAGLAAVSLLGGVAGHMSYKHAELGLTDRRLVRLGGIIGRDASTVDLADVRDVAVRVVPADKLFGTGRLQFQVAGGAGSGLQMAYVDDPYDALDRIEDRRATASAEGGPGDGD